MAEDAQQVVQKGILQSAQSCKGMAPQEAMAPSRGRAAARMTRRWDGLLGIGAYSDSLGNRAGSWRDRFDTARCTMLLLAFKKLNQA